MSTWNEGYVSDIAYSVGYYREMAPDHLAFAAISVGKNPGQSVKPERVLELGFGMGIGFLLGAASQPNTFFEGCDFNPEHIGHAKKLADSAGLTNVSIREASFQDLAAEASEGQQDLDIIQLHGILTWVSLDARMAIIEIARKRLKPGGLLYVSYNCMPGWAPFLPMRHLMREHAKRSGGSSIKQVAAAFETAKRISETKSGYFGANMQVSQRIEKMGSMQASYLAHEYFNENWFIFNFSEVSAMMADAKLTYLASASIAENIDVIAAPAEMRELIGQASDPVWKETLRDVGCNKQFRRDIYGRGTAELNQLETLSSLNNTSFTLAIPRSVVSYKMPSPLGEMEGKPDLYGPLADLLDGRIVSFGEIATLGALQAYGLAGTLQALGLLINAGQVLPIIGEPGADFTTAQRLNRCLAGYAEHGRLYNFVAAPAARAALPAANFEMFCLSALTAGKSELDSIVSHVDNLMRRVGSKPLKDGKPIEEPEAFRSAIAEQAKAFLFDKLPLWRRLGVL